MAFLYVGLVFLFVGVSIDRLFLFIGLPFLALGIYGIIQVLRKSRDADSQDKDKAAGGEQ